MKHLAFFALLQLFPQAVHAQETELLCYWEREKQELPEDDTGQFFGSQYSALLLTLDMSAETADFGDQNWLLPNPSVQTDSQTITVSVVQPNIRFLKGKRSVLSMKIDRYTLKSILFLQIAEGDVPISQTPTHWLRTGECHLKKL